ncbi:MAG: DUF4397 domain-containing protein, partial [Haloarculaceae archaeon]
MTATTDTVRSVLLAVVVIGSVLALGAVVTAQEAGDAQNQTAQSQSTSYLRVAHASPDAPAVDVYLDDQLAFENVSFGEASSYAPVEAGNHSVRITVAGDEGAIVYDDTIDVQSRTASTLTATGEVSPNGTVPFGLVGFLDDAYDPGANMSAVSVAHFSPDAGPVDVTVAGSDVVLADGLSYRNASDYVNVPAGNYTLEVRDATPGNNGTVMAFVDVSLDGGSAYTAMAAGYVGPEGSPGDTPFQVSLLEDATVTINFPAAAPTPTPTPGNMTETPTATPGNMTETPTATPGNATATPTGTATPTAT